MVAHDHQATTHLEAIHGSAQAVFDFLEFSIHFHANRLEHAGQKAVHFTTLVGEHGFHHRLHIRRQNFAIALGGGHFNQADRQLKGAIHIGILAEGCGKRIGIHRLEPFLGRHPFAAVHAQVQRIVTHKRKAAGRIIYLVAANTQIVKDTVQSIRSNFVLQFAKAHRMHNELGLHARKALRRKGHRFFVAVKSVQHAVFIQFVRNRVRMSAAAQSAVGISSIGLNIQAVKAFLEHYRIVIEHTVFNAGQSGCGMLTEAIFCHRGPPSSFLHRTRHRMRQLLRLSAIRTFR